MLSNKRMAVVALLLLCGSGAGAQSHVFQPDLPEDFPDLVATRYGETAPGVFIGWLGWWVVDYYVVLDQSGFPLFYSKTDSLSYPGAMPNGLLSAPAERGFTLKDETFAVVDSFQLSEGYRVDIHDFKLLPNGHALLQGKYGRHVDMSRIVPGGRPDAEVTGDVVQEIDADKHVLFEWHVLDHIPLTDSFHDLTSKRIDYAHLNSLTLDPIDNHLLLSFRTTSDIVKVSRSTGEIIWRLGGRRNDFTFVGEHEENAPYYFVGQHAVWRLPNGDILFFDNGNITGGGLTESDRDYSRGVAYHLDEVNMTATLVWEFRHDPDIRSPSGGRVQPLANGNVLIDWGSAIPRGTPEVPLVTEVSPTGALVYELHYATAKKGARLQKYVWNSPDLVQAQTYRGIEPGATYDSNETGVTVTVNGLETLAQNGLVVKRHADAPRFPRFPGRAPRVLVGRVTLAGFGIDDFTADVGFDVRSLDGGDRPDLTVYHRPRPGQGVLTPLPTVYEPNTGHLIVTDVSFGEFIFAYPDAPELPLPPILYEPRDLAAVNETQPVVLTWTSQGFARSFQLQVATDVEFDTLVVDESGLKSRQYTLDAVEPDTTYYWRIRTTNEGGTGAWATRSFASVEPRVQVIAPSGGEPWQRGLKYFIRWDDNLAEDVVIELRKGDAFVQTIGQVPSIGVYEWEADLAVEPGDDYSIRIKSATDETIWGQSDAAFSLE